MIIGYNGELMLYLAVEILVVSALMVATYRALLERKTKHGWCRLFLVTLPILSVAISSMEIPLWSSDGSVEWTLPLLAVAENEQPIAEPDFATPLITLREIILGIYVLGVVILLSLMVYQWIKILRLKSGAEIVKIGNTQIVKTDKPITTFSFFGSIYLPSNISEQDLDIILLHEQSHINHNHSLERIAMELQKALLWWNPSIWYASRLLTEVEEYEADQDVLDSGQDRTNYIQTIFKHLFGYNPEIANGLRNSLTKKRFIMMTTNQKSRYERLRTAALLPIILILVTMFGTTARSSELPSSIEASIADGKSKQIYVVDGNIVESIFDIDTDIIDNINIYESIPDHLRELLEGAGYTAEDVEIGGCIEISLIDEDKRIPLGTTAIYQGEVVDLDLMLPIVGAIIRISKDKGVVSDANGRFSIETVSGTVGTCEMIGFESVEEVSFGRNPNIKILMKPENSTSQVIRLNISDRNQPADVCE